VSRVAAVVIGRNEGPRLRRCLLSMSGMFAPTVYVDSDSSDGSPAAAAALGAEVVNLSLALPFTFGRGRNTGAARVLDLAPDTEFIQFFDADSEMASGWCESAVATLSSDAGIGAVWGRVRERNPAGSVYDRLFEISFDPRTHEPEMFGGLVMLRVAAYLDVGRYNESMRSFEDHELSFRMRQAGWQLRYLDAEMALHEAGMTRFSEWWRRERRGGHARAQQVALHRDHRGWLRAYGSIWFWAVALPAAAVGAAWPTHGASLWLLFSYPLFGYRIYRRMRRRGIAATDAALFASGRVIGKLPQLHGVVSFHLDALRGISRGS